MRGRARRGLGGLALPQLGRRAPHGLEWAPGPHGPLCPGSGAAFCTPSRVSAKARSWEAEEACAGGYRRSILGRETRQ